MNAYGNKSRKPGLYSRIRREIRSDLIAAYKIVSTLCHSTRSILELFTIPYESAITIKSPSKTVMIICQTTFLFTQSLLNLGYTNSGY